MVSTQYSTYFSLLHWSFVGAFERAVLMTGQAQVSSRISLKDHSLGSELSSQVRTKKLALAQSQRAKLFYWMLSCGTAPTLLFYLQQKAEP